MRPTLGPMREDEREAAAVEAFRERFRARQAQRRGEMPLSPPTLQVALHPKWLLGHSGEFWPQIWRQSGIKEGSA
jgi:hypothetical protein